jgi:hypothetical protein
MIFKIQEFRNKKMFKLWKYLELKNVKKCEKSSNVKKVQNMENFKMWKTFIFLKKSYFKKCSDYKNVQKIKGFLFSCPRVLSCTQFSPAP